jgi:hypothetical protein
VFVFLLKFRPPELLRTRVIPYMNMHAMQTAIIPQAPLPENLPLRNL